jgi:hypothetical protein
MMKDVGMTSSKRTARAVVIASFSLASILALYAIGGLAMTAALTASLPVSEASAASGDNSSNSSNSSNSTSNGDSVSSSSDSQVPNTTSSGDGDKIDESDEGHLRSGVNKCLEGSSDNIALEKCLSNAIDSFEFYRGQEHE